jgi:hypothetical protein
LYIMYVDTDAYADAVAGPWLPWLDALGREARSVCM